MSETGITRAYKVIGSCKTMAHLLCATNYVLFAIRQLEKGDWARVTDGIALTTLLEVKKMQIKEETWKHSKSMK